MTSIVYNISQVLGITVIHSLWQALLIYFVLRMALAFGNKLSAAVKYHLALTSLLAITGWFIYTLVTEIGVYNWLAVRSLNLSDLPAALNLPAGIHQFNDQSIRYYYDIEGYLPYIAAIYIIGLLFNTVKLVMARKKVNTIKQTMSVDIPLQYQVNRLINVLNIGQAVKIGLSKLVDVPCMAGYLKPVILLPFTVTNYLSAEEIEAILLHELAHIKRNDYLVNMIQQVISILLFFNPCTLLINRIINEERENCCDDLVVKATADPIIYAKALLKLEQTRQNDWQLALAATGKKYHLLNRIERIMKTKKQVPSLRPALLATLILTVGIGCLALLKPEVAEGKISIKNISPVISAMLSDTSHKAKSGQTAKKTHHTAVHKSSSRLTEAQNDAKMEDLNSAVQKYSEVVNTYFNNPEFKKMQEDIEKLSQGMDEYYKRPEVQRQQEELQKLGENFSKNWGEDDKQREMSAQIGKLGASVGAYFSTPEFKRMNDELRKKYGINGDENWGDDRSDNDENYKKYQAELESKLPSEIKAKTEKLKQMGEEIGARYKSPEYLEQSKRLQELGDSVSKAYASPDMTEKQQEIAKIGAKMSAYENSPDVKRAQTQLNIAVKRLTAFVNSTAYKNYMKMLSNMNFNYNFNDDNEKPEKAEKPEAPEKPEGDN